MPERIAFLYVGGPHHVFHSAPAAAALALRGDVTVCCFAISEAHRELIARCFAAYGAPPPDIQLFARRPTRPAAKLAWLWSLRRKLDRFDALVLPEYTSTILRRFGVKRPLFIAVPHGAGDRAVTWDRRLKLCDLAIVAGPKTAAGIVAAGLLPPGKVEQSGYLKLDLMAHLTEHMPLFENARPVVLYNPHFDPKLSSLPSGRAIVAQFAAQSDFNLVVAPHIRAFETAGRRERARWEALAVPGHIRVDLGSDASVDMTYTAGADIYLGDVSSQVYEFLARPRPCVFIDSHGADWRGDPDYRFWTLGDVAAPADALAAVRSASERHGIYRAAQETALAAAFGGIEGAASRAAGIIARRLGLATGPDAS